MPVAYATRRVSTMGSLTLRGLRSGCGVPVEDGAGGVAAPAVEAASV